MQKSFKKHFNGELIFFKFQTTSKTSSLDFQIGSANQKNMNVNINFFLFAAAVPKKH